MCELRLAQDSESVQLLTHCQSRRTKKPLMSFSVFHRFAALDSSLLAQEETDKVVNRVRVRESSFRKSASFTMTDVRLRRAESAPNVL